MSSTDTRGRFPIEPGWPAGGMVSKPLDDRHWDVQQYTGYAMSTVPAGQWNRGSVYRFMAPEFRPSTRELFMYDPTDPATFNYAGR